VVVVVLVVVAGGACRGSGACGGGGACARLEAGAGNLSLLVHGRAGEGCVNLIWKFQRPY
jgi:hypothetical protein